MTLDEFLDALRVDAIWEDEGLRAAVDAIPDDPPEDFSDDFKRRMNRFFREEVGLDYPIHPEVE